jgi:hypothetical protein
MQSESAQEYGSAYTELREYVYRKLPAKDALEI